MATVTRESIGTLHEKISVKLTKEDYMPSFEKALKGYAKSANVPGFRKGMVPAGMVRKMYGQRLFGDEVLRSAGQKLEDYIRAEKIEIFGQPMIVPSQEPINLDMGAPVDVDFDFEVGVKPDFEITPLKNKPTITHYQVEVSEKLVKDEVERLSKRYGKVEEKETIADDNDIVYAEIFPCDAEGNVAEDADKKQETVLFEKVPAKLKEILTGKKATDSVVFVPSEIAEGDELTSFLKDPLKTTAEDADAHYKWVITKVGYLEPRAVDAALFAEVFPNDNVTTEEEFKEKIKAELSKEFIRISNDRVNNEIFELLVHETPIELPVPFLKRWLKEGQDKRRSDAEVEKEFPSFDHQLRWSLISDKLMKENGVSVSRQEVIDEIKGKVLQYFGMENSEDAPWLDSYMAKIEKDQKSMDETYRQLLFDRLFTFLRTQVNLEEKSISEEDFYNLQQAGHHHHH